MSAGVRTQTPFALEWARGYRKEWLGADVVAGLTAAAVVIRLVGLNPQALDAVNRLELGGRLGRERMHLNLEQAVQAFQASRA